MKDKMITITLDPYSPDFINSVRDLYEKVIREQFGLIPWDDLTTREQDIYIKLIHEYLVNNVLDGVTE